MASRTSSRLVEQIAEALRASPDAAKMRGIVSPSVQTSFFPGPDPSAAALSDTEKYLTFFFGTLEYAPFPDARRPMFAPVFGIYFWDIARNWAATQMRTHVMGKGWMHSDSLAAIAGFFARSFTAKGN